MREKIYFASDFHLGSPNLLESHEREKKIISWLNEIKKDAKSVYLLGDVFDFWFEYNKVIPKGFVRILGKLSELSDNGIFIYFLPGNHDMWIKEYLFEEVGINICYNCSIILEQDKKIYIGHGDGLGKGDYMYKMLKMIFKSRVCRWLFSILHPDIGISLAQYWSNKSRIRKSKNNIVENQKDILINYCKSQQKIESVDYYIFGHRHLPSTIQIDKSSIYINTGDWISHNSYAVLSNGKIYLETYNN